MTLRMTFCTSRLADKPSSLKCQTPTREQATHKRTFTAFEGVPCPKRWGSSTVLAQDHFSSDFLSLHLTIKSHKDSMMMVLGGGYQISPSACAAGLMLHRSPPLTEWLSGHLATHIKTHLLSMDQGIPNMKFKLTWLVLGEDPAARSHRVEQFTAL